jgi:hypothetical protein
MDYGLVALPVYGEETRPIRWEPSELGGRTIPRQIRKLRSSPPEAASPFGRIVSVYTKDVCAVSE